MEVKQAVEALIDHLRSQGVILPRSPGTENGL
jgi:hypothetical protein